MAVQSPPEAPVVNQKGFEVIPAGTNTPTFSVNRVGDGYFAGSLRVDGQIQMTGGGTSGTVLGNNEFVSGLTTTAVVKRLIGVDTSNLVSIDTDAVGALFGGNVTVTGSINGPSNTLTVKTGAAAQQINVYGSNTIFLQVYHDGASTAGLIATGDMSLVLGTNSLTQWAVGASGLTYAFLPLADNGYDIGTTSFRVRSGLFGTSVGVGVLTNKATVGGEFYIGGNASVTQTMDVAGTAALGGALTFNKSNGTQASRTIVADGDTLGYINANGCAVAGTFAQAAQILFKVDGVPGAAADMPGRIEFYTSPDGSATPTLSLRLSANKAAVFVGTVTAPAYVVGAQAGANGTFANVTVVHGIVVSGT